MCWPGVILSLLLLISTVLAVPFQSRHRNTRRQVNVTKGNDGDPGEYCPAVTELPQPRDDITPIDESILGLLTLEGYELHREEAICGDVYILGKTVHLTHCEGSLENAQVVHCKIDYSYVFTGQLDLFEKATRDPTVKELWVHVDGRSFAKSYTWNHKLFDIKIKGSLGAGLGLGTGGIVGIGNLTVGGGNEETPMPWPNGLRVAPEGTVATT